LLSGRTDQQNVDVVREGVANARERYRDLRDRAGKSGDGNV
jgi:hypothetical protein